MKRKILLKVYYIDGKFFEFIPRKNGKDTIIISPNTPNQESVRGYFKNYKK